MSAAEDRAFRRGRRQGYLDGRADASYAGFNARWWVKQFTHHALTRGYRPPAFAGPDLVEEVKREIATGAPLDPEREAARPKPPPIARKRKLRRRVFEWLEAG